MAIIKHYNFDLSIEIANSTQTLYRAHVLNSPAGQASEEFELPFSVLELENFFLRIGRPRRNMRYMGSPELQAVQDFGSRLFTTIFTGQIQTCLQRSRDLAHEQHHGLRIRLYLSKAPLIADLPWEFLYDKDSRHFLAYSVETPLVRYLDLPQTITPLSTTLPLKVLVMIANPVDHRYSRLNEEEEWDKVQDALRELQEKRLVQVYRLKAGTLEALQSQLRKEQYHIFHFVGHGIFDKQTQTGVLLLEDEQGHSRLVTGQTIGAILRDASSLRLVLLNSCEGARTSLTDPFAGVAQHLIQQRIPAVIAMQFEITDQAAIILAHAFYNALADNYGVDAALSEARKALYISGNDIEWGTPVLYLRAPDGQLFDLESYMPLIVVRDSHSDLFYKLMLDLSAHALYGLSIAIIIVMCERYFLPATSSSIMWATGSFLVAASTLLTYLTVQQSSEQRYKVLIAGATLYLFIGTIAGTFLLSEERTGILILDVSEKMRGQFREVISYAENTRFADELDYVGLITFGGGLSLNVGCNDIAVQVEPTKRKDGEATIEQRLDKLSDAKPTGPETIQAAISKTIELLAGKRGYHSIVLVTSGILENSCDRLSRKNLEDRAQKLGVDFTLTIITVTSPHKEDKKKLEDFLDGQVATVPITEIPQTIESAFTKPRLSPYDFLYKLGIQSKK